jgi:hypothetical protein
MVRADMESAHAVPIATSGRREAAGRVSSQSAGYPRKCETLPPANLSYCRSSPPFGSGCP